MGKGKDDGRAGGADKGITLKGTKGDDVLVGTARNDILDGRKGNDVIDGGAGNDKITGGKGNDAIDGGGGNDVIYGDDGKGGGWGRDWCWWKPKSSYDDFIDGGAGSDKVYAGRGDDVVLYSMSGNLGRNFADIHTHDYYDGGTGSDTLRLALTYGELRLASVQKDIAAFEDFLEHRANLRSDDGKIFQFKSFDLDARNFEALAIQIINNAPTANNDSGATDEDHALVVAAPGMLANDSDPDHLDVLRVTGATPTSALDAVVLVGPDGALSYDPRSAAALQALAAGENATDSIIYSVADLGGLTATGSVAVTVKGVNDAPVAAPDSNGDDAIVEAGVNPGTEEFPGDPDAMGNVLANDTDVDHGAVISVADAGARAGTYGTLNLEADGDWTYALDNSAPDTDALAQDEAAVESFSYAVADEHGATGPGVLRLAVTGTNDARLRPMTRL